LDFSFSEKNFDVFKIAWEDIPGEWNPKESENPDKFMIERMNTVSSYAAQIMEARGIHGFVYSSQLWSELKEPLPFTNSIVIVGINPYKSTKNRFLISEGVSKKDANDADIESISFLDIIPELLSKSKSVNLEHNYLSSLSVSWDNEIASIGFDIVKTITKSTQRDDVMTNYSSFDWEIYQKLFLEDISCHNFDIKPTGLIRELWIEYSKLDYDFIRDNGCDEHIQYSHGDISPEFVDVVFSQYHVREFIRRLYSPYYELENDLEFETE
jgi:hypothetical protein